MQHVILVVSPNADFVQQIRSHLEEGGRYQVTGAASAHEALNYANHDFYEVAILDGELDDIPLVAFSRDLAALQTDLKILVFPPDNNPQSPFLDGLVVHGFLNKPFSGSEIGKSLTALFTPQHNGVDARVKQIDDLMKQWLQNPATGSKKAEQIQQLTSAEVVLIMIQKQTTASSKPVSPELQANLSNFLNRYWIEYENSELARFLKVDHEEFEKFVYATKLISNVVLVLLYPHTATLQKVRRELMLVKEDFQKNYPTMAELRQEIANQALAEINQRNKQLESLQSSNGAFSQAELDALSQAEQPNQTVEPLDFASQTLAEIKQRNQQLESIHSSNGAFSQAELDALSQADQSKQPVDPLDFASQTLAEIKQRNQQLESIHSSNGAFSQAELDALSQADQSNQPVDPLDFASQTLAEIKQRNQQLESIHSSNGAFSQAELDALSQADQSNQPVDPLDFASQTLAEINERNKQLESLKPSTNVISQSELDALAKPKTDPASPGLTEEELANLTKMITQMPEPDPNQAAAPQIVESDMPGWLKELDSQIITKTDEKRADFQETVRNNNPLFPDDEQSMAASNTSSPVSGEVTPVETEPTALGLENSASDSSIETVVTDISQVNQNVNLAEKTDDLPGMDLKMPWEIEEVISQQTIDQSLAQPIHDAEGSLTPTTEKQPDDQIEPVIGASSSFGAVLAESVAKQSEPALQSQIPVAEPEPPEPPTLQNFKFTYTCVLIPKDKDQFITRDLSEKINALMSQHHLAQGWKLSSITIRPQYLLWTVCVPLGVSIKLLIQDIRRLTTADLKANFSEIDKKLESSDFWSANYLAVSGSEPPPVNLIYDFVAQVWKNKETATH